MKLYRRKRPMHFFQKTHWRWAMVPCLFGILSGGLIWKGCTGTVTIISDNTAHPAVKAFDGKRAFDFLVQQVNFGNRVPDTEPSRQTQNFISQKLEAEGAQVFRQEFTVTYRNKDYRMVNVFGIIRGRIDRKVLICAHYDTRPVADQDPSPENRNKPIPGANDGASGVAILLEIAHVLKINRPPCTVVFAFFDGEDLGDISDGGMFFGSKYFANNLTVNGINLKADKGLLLDMVGDKEFRSTDELNSRQLAGQVVDEFLRASMKLNQSRFFFQPPTMSILDDHIPLNEAGIPTADIIDFDYRYWHTLQDTPDKCSHETLSVVGKTVVQWIMDISFN